MPRPHPAIIVCAAVIAAAAVSLLRAGPLDPPAGPLASTYKTISEVEPRTAITAANTPGSATALFRVSQPGSYYLTGNLTGVASKAGIEIAASDVTLDLSGFRLQGVANSLAAISIVGTQSNVTIQRGTIRGWAGGGIAAGAALQCDIQDIRAIGNTGAGIQVGAGSTLRRCRADSNSTSGISASTDAVISECSCRLNGATGITTNDHSIVAATLVRGNTGNGLTLGAANLVSEVLAGQNAVGISAGSGLNAVNTIARDNNSHGFFCFGGSFTNCVATSNTGDGFSTDAAIITGCRSSTNGGNGYQAGNNSLIAQCVAASNNAFGISCVTGGYALRNLCAGDCVAPPGSELREIKFVSRGRADGNYLSAQTNSSVIGIGGGLVTLMLDNSLTGGSEPTLFGYQGPDVTPNNIGSSVNSGNYYAPGP